MDTRVWLVAHARTVSGCALSLGGDTTKTDKPTPIPQRASAPKSEPKPLLFPQPKVISTNTNDLVIGNSTWPVDMNGLPISPLDSIHALEVFVADRVSKALHAHDERQARALYKVVMDWPIAEIMTMGEEQFIALYRSVLEEE